MASISGFLRWRRVARRRSMKDHLAKHTVRDFTRFDVLMTDNSVLTFQDDARYRSSSICQRSLRGRCLLEYEFCRYAGPREIRNEDGEAVDKHSSRAQRPHRQSGRITTATVPETSCARSSAQTRRTRPSRYSYNRARSLGIPPAISATESDGLRLTVRRRGASRRDASHQATRHACGTAERRR